MAQPKCNRMERFTQQRNIAYIPTRGERVKLLNFCINPTVSIIHMYNSSNKDTHMCIRKIIYTYIRGKIQVLYIYMNIEGHELIN